MKLRERGIVQVERCRMLGPVDDSVRNQFRVTLCRQLGMNIHENVARIGEQCLLQVLR